MVDAKTEGWIEIAQRGFENWKAKPHNARWFRKIDGTPIPNDLTICIGEAFAEPLRSLTLRVEAEKRAKEEATEDTRSLCRFILSEWGPDGALKATTYSLEQREARSAKGGDANDSGPSRPIDATSPGVTAGASTLEAAETHSAALAGALEEAKGVWKPISALWSKPAECGKGCPPRQVCDFCQRELFLGWNGDYVELWNTTNYYLCRERSEPHWKHMAEEAARLTHFMAFDMPDRALTSDEAEALWRNVEAADADRKARIPDQTMLVRQEAEN